MSRDLNSCSFIARLGADPETRYTQDGKAIANFNIACGWKSQDKEGVEWVRCVAFGKTAEIAEKYLRKGSQVYVNGRMQTRKWDDKEGVTRYTTEIVVNDFQMLGSKSDSQEGFRKPKAEAEEDKLPF